MRVAMTFPYSARRMTGIGAVARALTTYAVGSGLEALWVVPDGSGAMFFSPPDHTDLREVLATNRAHGQDVALAWGTARELLRLRKTIALIHAHQPHLQTLASIFVARLRRWPVVVTFHGRLARPENPIRKLFLRWIEQRIFAWATAVVMVSDESLRQFGDPRAHVIHNGVATPPGGPNLERRDAARKVWESGDLPVVLFAGRFSQLKGVFDILDAAAFLVQAGSKFVLVFIGNGSEGEEEVLRKRIEGRGLGKSTRVFGATNDYQRFLEGADVFVLPSYLEGLPIGLLEAMARGLPIVATVVGGIPEAVRDGIEGLLVTPGDIPALREALSWMLAHPQERAEMGVRAADRVRTSFSEEQMASAYLSLYYRFLGPGVSPYKAQNRSA